MNVNSLIFGIWYALKHWLSLLVNLVCNSLSCRLLILLQLILVRLLEYF